MPIRVRPKTKRNKYVDAGPRSGFSFNEEAVSSQDYAISENGRRLEKLTSDWYSFNKRSIDAFYLRK